MRRIKSESGSCVVEYALTLVSTILLIAISSNFVSSLQGPGSLVTRFASLEINQGGGSGGSGGVASGLCDFSNPSVKCTGTQGDKGD